MMYRIDIESDKKSNREVLQQIPIRLIRASPREGQTSQARRHTDRPLPYGGQ